MKYFFQIMLLLIILATASSFGVIVASFFVTIYALYMWVTLFLLSVGMLIVYIRLIRSAE